MNDKIARLTEELRAALAEEAAVKNYLAAKEAYIADEEIVRLANEYNVQREIYETESSKEEADTLLLDSVKAR
ncbi:MAG: YlbF family regulator, partial [Clostridia bacterium]|nr:YlbF family regulator [Clostridia bacterium]